MDMSMHMTMTSTGAMPSSTSSSMGGHGGGGHGSGTGCKISMLWNWNVINSCFISSSWKITSNGMFAGSCIGVILLVMSLEFLRRLGHEFDKYTASQPSLFSHFFPTQQIQSQSQNTNKDQHQHQNQNQAESEIESDGSPSKPAPSTNVTCPGSRQAIPNRRPTLIQHALRSLLHMVQFGVAYFVMLLAMYYNGYIIICILIGSFLGSLVFSWKTNEKNDACSVTVCCG